MSGTRKLLSLAAIAAVLGFYLMPSPVSRPLPAYAGDCTTGNTGTLVIRIEDSASGHLLNESGTEVLIKPDPTDFILDQLVADTAAADASGSRDKSSQAGVIRFEDACSTQGSEVYTISLWGLPSDLAECDFVTDTATTSLAADATREVTLKVDCTGVGATPTATATATSGPAATVVANTSPLAVSCNGTSVISVSVRDAAGNPVQTGTAVTITSSLGSVSPSSGIVTGSNGTVFAFFTAPSNSGGTATVTATAGSASGTAGVTVTCGSGSATATVGPPPTVTTGGSVIQPPNTGSAGLQSNDHSSASVLPALAALIAVAGLGVSLRVRRT